jgi:fluoride exporter
MTLGLLLATGAAGAVGTVLRFSVDGAVMRALGRPFPLGTMVVNVSAALLLGLVVGLVATGRTQTVVGTGLLGGYSTFSTWMLETRHLYADRQSGWAVVNVVASVAGGVLGIVLGRAIGRGF